MQTVTSADGTEIAYERHGDGSPVILLHGASADRHAFRPLVPHLAGAHSLIVPDRRGRGDSGDGPTHSLDREIEDLRALIAAVDGTPAVFGHSFGGLVALASASELSIGCLALYEPSVLVGEHRADDLADRMQERLEAGDRRGALRLFLEEAGGVPDATALPWWPAEAPFDRVETVIRENRAVEAYRLPEDPAVDGPTLLVTGDRGPTHLRDAVSVLVDRLPDARVRELEGVGHVGIESAPERVAGTVEPFLG